MLTRVEVLPGGKARITVTLDGAPYLKWEGLTSALSQHKSYALTDPISLGWISYRSTLVFHRIQLRMLSGRIDPLN